MINDAPILSIIIAVYRVEEYICECIDSVLSQDINNFEIILIDDGSPDNSGQICDEYANKYDNIKVIHKENGGQSSARNAGMVIAKGKYITFVDSDDCISPNTYKPNLKKLIESGADFIQFPYVDKWNTSEEQIKCMPEECIIINDPLKYLGKQIISGSVWNKIYKYDIIKNIKFKEGVKHEDMIYVLDVCKISKNAIINKDGTYLYRPSYQCNYIKYPFPTEIDFIDAHKYYHDIFLNSDKKIAKEHWLWIVWLFIYKMVNFSDDEKKIIISKLNEIKFSWCDIIYMCDIKRLKHFLLLKFLGITNIIKIIYYIHKK